MNARQIYQLTKASVSSWIEDYAPSMGAAIAYYTLFSITPMVLIVISVAGLVFGQEAAQGEMFEQLQELMGPEGAMAVQGLLQSVNKPEQGIAGAVIGVLLSLLGASTVLGELQSALDRIFHSTGQDKKSGIMALLWKRLLSFGMVLGIGFLLMVSLLLSAALAILGKWWNGLFGAWQILAQAFNLALSFLVITLLFAMIYKFMPSVRLAWRDVWIGAAVTSLLFAVGKYLIGLYIGRAGVSSGFGAAGSLVVMLVWVYYSAQIFLLGAEFTSVYARTHGSRKPVGPVQDPAFA
ncbi:MAG: YihY/virulence factor BrkB family protein [Noviherbaspirillum sp.]